MKNNFIYKITILFLIDVVFVHPDSLNCPYGSTPTIDGILSSGEWTDALHLVDQSKGSHMYVKHDGVNVYFAFDSVPSIPGDIEQCFDTENDDATTPQPDDRHYGFCTEWVYEENGDGSYWVSVPIGGWTQICTWITPYSLWRGEVCYTFAELGITSGLPDTLGMMLQAGFNWGGTDFTNPSTWSNFYSSSNWSVGIKETASKNFKLQPEFLVYPNPFSEKTEIRYTILDAGYKIHDTGFMIQDTRCMIQDGKQYPGIAIYDVSGRIVKSFNLESCIMNHESAILWFGDDDSGRRLSSGVYFIRLEDGDFKKTEKVILLR
jgi:hypothetical protein